MDKSEVAELVDGVVDSWSRHSPHRAELSARGKDLRYGKAVRRAFTHEAENGPLPG